MRLRKQRHKNSCGLACVAMLANKAYNDVLQDFEALGDGPIEYHTTEYENGKVIQALSYDTTTLDLHYLLNHYGVRSNKRWIRYKGNLPPRSILAINYRKQKTNGRSNTGWHWVVCECINDDTWIYDPSLGKYGWSDDVKIHAYIRIHED